MPLTSAYMYAYRRFVETFKIKDSMFRIKQMKRYRVSLKTFYEFSLLFHFLFVINPKFMGFNRATDFIIIVLRFTAK